MNRPIMNRPIMNRLSRTLIVAVLAAAAAWNAAAEAGDYIPTPLVVREVFGRLGPVPVPEDNPMSAAKVALGKHLFEDPLLSGDGSLSCESCHLPDSGYTVQAPLSPAFTSKFERRNSPTLINVGFNLPLLWDGRAGALDKQPLGSLGNVLHLNNNADLLVEQLKADAEYPALFAAAFDGDGITAQRIGQAIGAFERSLVFDDSPFDRYMTGDRDALSGPEKLGLGLFMRGGRCITCHHGPNLTDNQFHALGVPDDHVTGDPDVLAAIRFDARRRGYEGWESLAEDPGRALVTGDAADVGRFRTPGLRNVAETAPYMHNGAFETLEEVVAHYNKGGGDHPNKSRRVNPLKLSDEDQANLVTFLKALTGTQRALDLP